MTRYGEKTNWIKTGENGKILWLAWLGLEQARLGEYGVKTEIKHSGNKAALYLKKKEISQ